MMVDMDYVINACHTFENQNYGIDKSFEEKKVFFPQPEQLKETKVVGNVFHTFVNQTVHGNELE